MVMSFVDDIIMSWHLIVVSPVWVVSVIVCAPSWALIGSWPMTCDLIACSVVTETWELAWCINSWHTPQSGVVAVWETSSWISQSYWYSGDGKQEGLGFIGILVSLYKSYSCYKWFSISHVWLLIWTSLLAVLPASWSAHPWKQVLHYQGFHKKFSKPLNPTNLDTFIQPMASIYVNQRKIDGVKIGQFEPFFWSPIPNIRLRA